MASFLDTSLLVPLLIREPGTPMVQAFLSAGAAKALLISPWTITEFSSALALKKRVRSISRQERRAALTMFDKFRSLRLELVPMEEADFEAAARLSMPALRHYGQVMASTLAITWPRDILLIQADFWCGSGEW